MKLLLYFYIVGLTAVALTGCRRGTSVDNVLEVSDSLANKQLYDSVLTVLKHVEHYVPDWSEKARMHYAWRLAEAQYYEDKSMADDSLLPRAVLYYKEQGDTAKTKLAPLLEAGYWRWKNNPAKVLQTLSCGIQEAKRLEDNLQQACLYASLAQFQYDNRQYAAAIGALLQALRLSEGMPLSERHPMVYLLAICYDLTKRQAIGREMYQKAIQMAGEAGDSLMALHYLRNYASSLNAQGKPEEALSCLRRIDTKNSPYKAGMVTVTVEMAYAFLQQHRLDSAQYYVNRSMDFINDRRSSAGEDPSIRCSVYSLQQLIQYARGGNPDRRDMGRYLDSVALDNVQKNSTMKQRMETEMNLLNRNNELVIARQRLWLWLFLALVIIVGGSFGLYLYIRKRRGEMQEMEERLEALNRLVEDAGRAEEADKAGDAFFKKVLLQQLGILKIVATEPTSENQRLLHRLLSISDDRDGAGEALLAWDDLYRVIDRIYQQFYSRVKTRYGGTLLEKEIQTLCLIRAGFSTKEIGVVTQQSTAMVYMRKTAIRKKLGIDMKGDILAFVNSREGTETLC